jgi:hypothetical protein
MGLFRGADGGIRRSAGSQWLVVMMAVAVAASGASACSSGSSSAGHARVADTVHVKVSSSRPLHVTLPRIATLTAPAGAFRGQGQVAITTAGAALPYGGSLTAAGTGIDVAFSGVTLVRPITISFDVAARPQPGDIAVVAHQLADGSWTLAPAALSGTKMTVAAQQFSLHIPAWLNPSAWLHWLGNRLASLVGGRTAPINCPGGAPTWASVSKPTDEVHTCLVSNVDPATKAVRAEMQIKSNRGTALEVDVPAGASYTWVQDQPWAIRSWVWAHVIHQDPATMVLLPADATMTAGFTQPGADEDLGFVVGPSYWSLKYTLVGDIVDALTSLAADKTGMAVLYLVAKCTGAIDPGSLSVHVPLSTATFGSVMSCAISDAASELSSPQKALGAARSLLGPGVDELDLDTATKELTSVGGKLLEFGWVVALWPVLQAGWGGTADVVHSLLTGGESSMIDLNLKAVNAPTVPAAYDGNWYSSQVGAALSLQSDGEAILQYSGITVQLEFKPNGSGLLGKVTVGGAGNTGFQDGVVETITPAADGGIVLSGPAADGAEFYRTGTAASGYFRYTDPRFKFSFDVPIGYTGGVLPADRDGRSFTNSAATATVAGFGQDIGQDSGGMSPADDLEKLISAYESSGDQVTLRYLNGDIVAVSGTTPTGEIFYQRDVVFSLVIYSLVWNYPATEKAQYNQIVDHTVSSYTPGPDQGN